MLKMAPLGAASEATGARRSVAVDEETRVWSSRNWAAPSLTMSNVNWVFFLVATITTAAD